MADYYTLLAKAVANFPKDGPAAPRKAIYDRARTALRRHLRALGPTLSEADIGQEEASLETAIARLETRFTCAPAAAHAPFAPAAAHAPFAPAVTARPSMPPPIRGAPARPAAPRPTAPTVGAPRFSPAPPSTRHRAGDDEVHAEGHAPPIDPQQMEALETQILTGMHVDRAANPPAKKKVALSKASHARRGKLPASSKTAAKAVDLATHTFERFAKVALL